MTRSAAEGCRCATSPSAAPPPAPWRGASATTRSARCPPRATSAPRAPAGGPRAPGARRREDETRKWLAASNERRGRRGEEPLDVEAELARLTAPAVDPGLEAEVRQLVIARNERRARRGQPPLDVEQEVARQLRELT